MAHRLNVKFPSWFQTREEAHLLALFRAVDTAGGCQPPYHFLENFFFLRKIGLEEKSDKI